MEGGELRCVCVCGGGGGGGGGSEEERESGHGRTEAGVAPKKEKTHPGERREV